ncbi:thioredoxin family protein [Pinirhizobacter soli]|uniref:thioredoxin family protein n=1 Tax=Pinirhizobacter soli TaxID=2786953 RepID=UPI002029EE61|nr:thioredoxin family protein [Pinirhizobacter soli]
MFARRFLVPLLAALVGTCAILPASAQQAPEFTGIAGWLNSKPLTMQGLRGKVVLVDFWAYSCINCIRTFPHVTQWYEKYKDKGLVIVGVHAPEFNFERQEGNVRDAIKRYNITYPVALDNDLKTWDAFSNQYWPAEYLIDKNGNIISKRFGEGHYLETENQIRTLLGLPPLQGDEAPSTLGMVGSPEMYFGSDRQEFLASPESGRLGTRDFTAPTRLELNKFALVGAWEIGRENATLVGDHGEIRLHYKAAKLHMVASAVTPTKLEIIVDGKPQPPVTVQGSMLYTLADGADYKDHVVTIKIPKGSFHAFTFTFG